MSRFHILGLLLIGLLNLLSCKNTQTSDGDTPPKESENQQLTSEELLRGFPLLALIEKTLWKELLHQETIVADAETSDSACEEAQKKIGEIAIHLRELHPFSRSEDTITLGAISYHQKTGTLEFTAKVNDLKARQKGDQEDVELVLCTQKGRSHESLFVTEARPLHLEILLHLAGYTKEDVPSQFEVHVLIPNHPPIELTDLLVSKTGETVPSPLLWEFSGSAFDGLYQPDLTGDLIICWHAHDSVLRVTDERIARNETRLLAKPHPELEPDMAVKIVLVPMSSGR